MGDRLDIPDPSEAVVFPYKAWNRKTRYRAYLHAGKTPIDRWDVEVCVAWFTMVVRYVSTWSFSAKGDTPEQAQVRVTKKYCDAVQKFREWHSEYLEVRNSMKEFDPMKVCRDLRGED